MNPKEKLFQPKGQKKTNPDILIYWPDKKVNELILILHQRQPERQQINGKLFKELSLSLSANGLCTKYSLSIIHLYAHENDRSSSGQRNEKKDTKE